jgi:uncharacterized membrane protein YsdA (DUF1294 family)
VRETELGVRMIGNVRHNELGKGGLLPMRKGNARSRAGRRNSAQTTYGLLAMIVLAILGFLLYEWLHWDFYWIWLIVVNVVTLFFFRYDKGQAQREGATRVPEVILLALLLAGGVLGGAAGMLMRPRHKTQKAYFWVALAVATLVHGYLIYAWRL